MTMARNRLALPFLRVWGWPLLLGLLTMFGLLSALLGEAGLWWALSWTALSLPLLVILACFGRAWRQGRAAARQI